MSPWKFLRFLFLPALIMVASLVGGWWSSLVPFICFIIHPIAGVISKGKSSFDIEEESRASYNSTLYRLIPFLFVPGLITVTTWTVISSGGYSFVEFAGLALSVGIVNGILGFTLGH